MAGSTRPLSHTAPSKMQTVMVENIPWKLAKAISGYPSRSLSWVRVPRFWYPKLCRLPMNLLEAVLEKAKEYPQKYHWNWEMQMAANVINIICKADFLLASPEYRYASPKHIISTRHVPTISVKTVAPSYSRSSAQTARETR